VIWPGDLLWSPGLVWRPFAGSSQLPFRAVARPGGQRPRGDGRAVVPEPITMDDGDVAIQSQQSAIADQVIGHRACSQQVIAGT
jgi:hypothetical protein